MLQLASFAVLAGAQVTVYLSGGFSGNPIGLSFFVGIDVMFAYAILYEVRFLGRKIVFTDGKLTIQGWRTRMDVPYSEVGSVRLVYVKYLRVPTPWRGVQFAVSGYDKPFLYPGNPRLRKSKTRLYSWLTEMTNWQAQTGRTDPIT
jgi:hypothetical protein